MDGRSFATVAFIAFAAGVAVVLSMRPTTLHGKAAAAMIQKTRTGRTIKSIDCESARITLQGAKLACTFHHDTGRSIIHDVTLMPDGRLLEMPRS